MNLTSVFQYCQNTQIKYFSGKRLKFFISWASLGKQFLRAEQEHTVLPVTRLEIQVFYSLFSVWLRQSTGTWFLHVRTGNKTISSIQKYSANLHSKTRDRTSSRFWQLLNRLFRSSTSDNTGASPFPTSQHTTIFSFHCTAELGSSLPSWPFFSLPLQDQ